MHKNPVKEIIKPQLAGLIIGTVLAASIQLALVPPVMSFYGYVITLYFLAGLISGYLSPMLSWWWGIWLTLPWIAWIFFNIASTGFKDGIVLGIVWLFFYSFPFFFACLYRSLCWSQSFSMEKRINLIN